MKAKKTVTIGIPAYNEEHNIAELLMMLKNQQYSTLQVDHIYVVSDASSDNTAAVVSALNQKKVTLISNKSRNGKVFSLNRLLKFVSTDIFVVLDADIMIHDKNFIEKLCRPIVNDTADMTSARVEEMMPENMLQLLLANSMKFKKEMFEKYNFGNNIYTCHGRARAMTKSLYKTMKYDKATIGEDAYSYLYTVTNGFRYQFSPKAAVYYKLPSTFKDHEKQSIRFLQSKKQLYKHFDREFVANSYKIPSSVLLKTIGLEFFRHPLLVTSYVVILVIMKVKSFFVNYQNNTWEIAASSKILVTY